MADCVQNCKVFNNLEFFVKRESSSILCITISVSSTLVNKIKKHTLDIYKTKMKSKGFGAGLIPEHYVETNCTFSINESCSKFVLKFFVLDFLEENIQDKKMVCLSRPKLVEIKCFDNGAINYIFRASVIGNICPDNWEKIHFSPPKRKLYKDLDRQAVTFIKTAEEELTIKKHESEGDKVVEDSDWVSFSTILLNNNNQPATRGYRSNFWLKIDTKYVVTPLHGSFLGRQEGEVFTVEDLPIFGIPSDLLSIKGKFKIIIGNIVKATKFSLDYFKDIFGLTIRQDNVKSKSG